MPCSTGSSHHCDIVTQSQPMDGIKMATTYGSNHDKPRLFRSKSPKKGSSEYLRRCANRIIKDYIDEGLTPITIRQLFYLMVSNHKIDKNESQYNALSKAIVSARRSGLLASSRQAGWECIRDEKFDSSLSTFGSIDATTIHIDQRRRQLFRQQALEKAGIPQPLIWCESAGMVPQISKYANLLGAPVYSSGGFDSLTAKRAVGCELWRGKTNTLVILHVGDKDKAGDAIYESLRGDVLAFSKECDCKVEVQRIAVSAEQIESLNLESYSVLKKDVNKDGFAVKAEAIPPSVLRNIVEGRVRDLIGDFSFKNQSSDTVQL